MAEALDHTERLETAVRKLWLMYLEETTAWSAEMSTSAGATASITKRYEKLKEYTIEQILYCIENDG